MLIANHRRRGRWIPAERVGITSFTFAVSQGTGSGSHHRANEIQLCLGINKVRKTRWSTRRRQTSHRLRSSFSSWWVEIYKEAPGRRRECLYYLALGQYKLGHYNEARRYNDLLLDKEPRNMQSLSLKALIEDRVAKGLSSWLRGADGRGICRDGDCRKRCGWFYCCCCDVGETALMFGQYKYGTYRRYLNIRRSTSASSSLSATLRLRSRLLSIGVFRE